MPEAVSGTANAKLPVIETIRRSYGDCFTHFGDVVSITWPWVVASTLAMGFAVVAQFNWMARAVADLKQSVPAGPTPVPVPPMPDVPPETLILAVLSNLVLIVALPSIAVAWHRRVLLDEAPGFAARNVTSGAYWRYASACVMLGLVVGLPLLMVTVPVSRLITPLWTTVGPGKLPSEQMWPAVVIAIACIIALATLMHLLLVLPARAIGNTTLTLGACWTRSRGNAWRIFLGLVATFVAPALLGQAIALGIAGHPGADLFKMSPAEIHSIGTQVAIASAVPVGFFLLTLPVAAGFLSHAYRYYFPET